MSLHTSVTRKTEPGPADIREDESVLLDCSECGETSFRQQVFTSYRQWKYANTSNRYADYGELEYEETNGFDAWECENCGNQPGETELLLQLEQM
jgi:ubiquitin C-terminal hydrolase